MTPTNLVTEPNLTRIYVALDRWLGTGEILVQALEKIGDTGTMPRFREAKQNIQTLREIVSQLRG